MNRRAKPGLETEDRIKSLEDEFRLFKLEYTKLEIESKKLRAELDFFANKATPAIQDYYNRTQVQTPRAKVKPGYKNSNTPKTHAYYILEAIYGCYPEGLTEEELMMETEKKLRLLNKNFSKSAFTKGVRQNISSSSLSYDEGVYYYKG